MRKTQNDWKNILKQQKESGLSINVFCQKNKIPTSSFYKYKQLMPHQSDFIQAKVTMAEKESKASIVASIITLETSAGRLSLPTSIAPDFLILLLRGLL